MKPNRTRLKIQFAVRHARAIRQGLADMYSIDQILDAWYSLHHPDAEHQTTVSTQMTRDWVRLNAILQDTEKLNNALGRLYADAWVMGIDISNYEIARAVGLKKAAASKKELQRALTIDWNRWRPGNRAAANLVSPPNGLKRLLQGRGVKIKGMGDTTLNRIGTALANGLNQGLSRKDMAKQLEDIVQDPERALSIAGTEMSGAVVQASLDSYSDMGVEEIEWLAADPCDDCQDNLDQSPIGINDEWRNGDPPVHPNCMCDIAPYVVDTGMWAWLREEE